MAKALRIGRCFAASTIVPGAVAFGIWAAAPVASSPSMPPPLVLERTILLGAVKGRIDHLACDAGRKRLFVAELGNGTIAVLDLEHGTVTKRIEGLHEPQGVGYVPGADMLYVASAGDGSLRRFKGPDLIPAGTLDLGDDADNVRLDGSDRVMVGYGSGRLATVDAASGRKLGEIALPAHPEGFQIDASRNRVYVNLPYSLAVASIDRTTGKIVGRWGLSLALGNFPIALDGDGRRLFVGYRGPATLAMIDAGNGRILDNVSTCGDADDVFYDGPRKRVYVTCGGGEVAIYKTESGLLELARVTTRSGARTSLFVPALDRLFVAVPAQEGYQAEVMVFSPR